ncbi:MAG TPA: cyclic dehypoxanthinyl futalosine synthase [Candidatus Angelobacter sp.]|jgi:cyclic dehypoxanthinyl futalosine synthase|nr:cyclic dehypoxanthinyl futalosine synthase [Candidatus Angelobacter sp.]
MTSVIADSATRARRMPQRRPAPPAIATTLPLQHALERAAAGERLGAGHAVQLLEHAPLLELAGAAHARRQAAVDPRRVTYQIDRNINYTNVCVTDCSFCAFYRHRGHIEAYTQSTEQILQRCGEAVELHATSVLLQGGHNPWLPISYYEELFTAIKTAFPALHVHALSPTEIGFIAHRVEQVPVAEVVARLRDAGLDSVPGGGAEILVDRVRDLISPKKQRSGEWLDVTRDIHRAGLPTTATMMMGHAETLAERVEHLRLLRELQDDTGGLLSFIPWTYQPDNTELQGARATGTDYLRAVAIARLMLDNVLHLQASWLTTGAQIGQLSLSFGADDLGSVMLEENVVTLAGAPHASNQAELIRVIEDAGFVAARRDTYYEILDVHRRGDGEDERELRRVGRIAGPGIAGSTPRQTPGTAGVVPEGTASGRKRRAASAAE